MDAQLDNEDKFDKALSKSEHAAFFPTLTQLIGEHEYVVLNDPDVLANGWLSLIKVLDAYRDSLPDDVLAVLNEQHKYFTEVVVNQELHMSGYDASIVELPRSLK